MGSPVVSPCPSGHLAEGNMKIALLVVLACVAAARAVPAKGSASAAAAALGIATELLNNLGNDGSCNAAGCCIWNDWKSRDQQSRIQKTYKNCRYSKAKKTFGINNGRYYCFYSPDVCRGFGNSLD